MLIFKMLGAPGAGALVSTNIISVAVTGRSWEAQLALASVAGGCIFFSPRRLETTQAPPRVRGPAGWLGSAPAKVAFCQCCPACCAPLEPGQSSMAWAEPVLAWDGHSPAESSQTGFPPWDRAAWERLWSTWDGTELSSNPVLVQPFCW